MGRDYTNRDMTHYIDPETGLVVEEGSEQDPRHLDDKDLDTLATILGVKKAPRITTKPIKGANMFYNEWDIQELVERARAIPALRPYASYLSQWVEIVNSNTDGWAYWKGGHRAANKLVTLLAASCPRYFGHPFPSVPPLPTPAELTKAITPIKSCATRKKLPKPVLDLSQGDSGLYVSDWIGKL